MWTTDTFLENLARFSVLKGQGWDGPTAVSVGLDGLHVLQRSGGTGALDGGIPMSRVEFKKRSCPLPLTRNSPVTYH